MDSFRGKRVVVLGLARSGEAAVRLLVRLSAQVLVSDQKGEDELKEIVNVLRSDLPQIEFSLGGHPDEIFNDADLVVISPGVPANIPALERVRKKGIPVIGEVELAYRVCRAPIVAITGTKGKSTTSTLAGLILSKGHDKGGKVLVAGNIGMPISRYVLELTEADLLVLEVSSFQLETTVNFKPEVSVILNIMQDHFDRHSGFEEYATAKYKIFANQTKSDYTVLNADDTTTAVCASRTKAKVILFSSRQELHRGVYVRDRKIMADTGQNDRVMICRQDDLRIPGRHNLENAMAATAVGLIYGVKPDAIADALMSFEGLEHALEPVGEINGVKFINDSKSTNANSLRAALESMDGNVILIIGGRDKGNDYSPLIELIKEKVKRLVIIGESAEKIQNTIGGYTDSYKAGTFKDAVNKAYEFAVPGDTVLMSPACASFDMFRDYAERGMIFKELVRDICRGIGKQ